MLDLNTQSLSYILVKSENINGLTSYLYSRAYYLLEIKSYFDSKFKDSIIAFTTLSPDEVRKDSLHLMDISNENSVIVKYKNDETICKIFNNGMESPLRLLMYNTDSVNETYIHEGISFSFIEQKRYVFPKRKEDFKSGMIIECFYNDDWRERKVYNPDLEFDKMYNLLMKYNKVRIPIP